MPITITLSGSDAVNSPLTSAGRRPGLRHDQWQPANLQYTPDANVSGLDHIRFTVGNGTSTSAAADVGIRILPSSSDVSGPTIQWVAPEAGVTSTWPCWWRGPTPRAATTIPPVHAQFSEAVDAATVNAQTVIVTDATGKVFKTDVRYDGASDQMQLMLREEPVVGRTYAVTITGGVKDLRGNPMAADYTWNFRIAGVGEAGGQPKVFLPMVGR
ncbi:MAG: Ig-like domain-containing protein [Anaerolineales bacterium]|nr:Ig-like domain-containing protein [Anaerolineales bacterium]